MSSCFILTTWRRRGQIKLTPTLVTHHLLLLLLQIADVSVEVATVDHTLQKICRNYRKSRRKPKGLQKLWARLLNIPHIAIITAAVVFVVVVIAWSLLWVFICKRHWSGRLAGNQTPRSSACSRSSGCSPQFAEKATAARTSRGCSVSPTWSSSPSIARRSHMSLYPWQPKSSMWYVLRSSAGDVGKV